MTSDSTTVRHRAIAGSLSGCATRFLCQPLDVLKIRFQVQIEPLKKSHPDAVYNGITQAFNHIIKKEGVLALWKGHVAAQALSITFGLFQFTAFGSLVNGIMKLAPQMSSYRPIVNFSAGFGAGCLATVASFPFDTLRTRLVVQGEPKIYKGITDATLKMVNQEGFFSLYRGLWPTLLQIGPYVGFQFALYNILVDAFKKLESEEHPHLRSLLSGAFSGAAAKAIVYPLDLGKKRLQVKGFHPRHQYHGLWHCLVTTSKTEGLPALWKGLSPSLVKALLTSALHFYFYEMGLRLMSSRSH